MKTTNQALLSTGVSGGIDSDREGLKRVLFYFLLVFMLVLNYAGFAQNVPGIDHRAADAQNENKFNESNIKSDVQFATHAAGSGMKEVQYSQLAVNSATSPQVRDLAKMMVDDHSKANDELKLIADTKGIVLPNACGKKSQARFEKLAKKKGEKFDKCYTMLMVKQHKKSIAHVEDEIKNGHDPELKSFATAQLPILQKHLEMANSIGKPLKRSEH